MEENEQLSEKYGKLGQSTVNLRVLGKSLVKWVIGPLRKILIGYWDPVTEVAADLVEKSKGTLGRVGERQKMENEQA